MNYTNLMEYYKQLMGEDGKVRYKSEDNRPSENMTAEDAKARDQERMKMLHEAVDTGQKMASELFDRFDSTQQITFLASFLEHLNHLHTTKFIRHSEQFSKVENEYKIASPLFN